MSADFETRSRRSLLGAGLGALAAAAATMVGRPELARATDGNPIVIGEGSQGASSATGLFMNTTNATVFAARHQGSGNGLMGEASTGTGVYGGSDQYVGIGVHGSNRFGTAIRADANGVAAHALVTVGRLAFDRSGVATIPANTTGVSVAIGGVELRRTSFILLTPQVNLGGRSLWYVMDVTANKFAVRISSKRSSQTKVSWLLLDRFEPYGG